MRSLTRPIAATLLLLVGGCTVGRGPVPPAAPEADGAADASVDPVADPPPPPTVDPPATTTEPPADPPAAATQPTCDDWLEWNFFRTASAELVRACLQAGADVNAVVGAGHTILHRAATFADGEVTALLLQAGADVNARAENGEAPLHVASDNNNLAAVTTLLEAGADVNDAPRGGNWPSTPLHAAAERDLAEMVNVLLDAGADVNAGAGGPAGTPLMSAIWTQDIWSQETRTETIDALLDAGADVNLANARGDTPLLWAMAHAELRLKLLELGANPNLKGTGGVTPLYRAAAGAGGPQAIRALLEAGANPHALTDDGESALHAAARRRTRTPEVITLLADAGLDVDAGNAKGQTPLHLARTDDNFPAIRKLLELGADPDARDNAGRVAAAVCVWEGRGDNPFHAWDFLAMSPPQSVRGCLESGIPVDGRHEEGATPLALLIATVACCADFENVLGEFLAAGADVNARDDHGRTPLHRVGLSSGNIVTSALLDAGADPGAHDLAGSTALHNAASAGRGRQVTMLVSAGADIDARDNRGRTPLHVAHDPATIRTLLELGADPTARDSAGTTADPAACERWGSQAFFAFATADVVAGCIPGGADAHTIADGSPATPLLFAAAASTPDPAVVSMLLEGGANVHARNEFRHYTPLHYAAQSGTPQVVRALLEAGADVDAWARGRNADAGWGWTPLHLAARSNPDPEVVRALLKAGADLHARSEESDFYRNTPLHYAGDNANPEVAAALLSAGADVNALSAIGRTSKARGRTPLHEAAANASKAAVIEFLVAAGADVNALDSNGHAPLHAAAWDNPRPEIATALIAAGADIEARDPDGYVPPGRAANDRTPLLMALYRGAKGSVAVVEVLLRAGANLEQTDGTLRTALHIAAIWMPAAFPLLLRLGADPNALDASGRTPWDYALRNPSLQGLEEVRRMREELLRGGAERE